MYMCFFFFNDTATTEIYTLSLHDALPICRDRQRLQLVGERVLAQGTRRVLVLTDRAQHAPPGRARREMQDRSEEHTSELQSRQYLVCRLLLEKKKKHELHTYPVNHLHSLS